MFEIDKLHIIFKVHLCVSYFILILGFIKMHTNQIQNSYNNLIILYLFIVVLPVILYQYYFECYCCKLK